MNSETNQLTTPEQLARKVLEEQVKIGRGYKSFFDATVEFELFDTKFTMTSLDNTDWERSKAQLKACLEKLLTTTIEKALAECPIPSGLSDKELVSAEETVSHEEDHDGWDRKVNFYDLLDLSRSLLNHIHHLHRIMRIDESEALCEMYARGVEDGKKAKVSGRVETTINVITNPTGVGS